MGEGEESATALTLQPDGKIVAAGYTDLPHEFGDAFGPGKFAVARYGVGGRLDPNFDGDGKVKTAFAGGTALAYGVALAPGGEIVVAGDVDFDRFALVRYTGDGSLDPAFSGNGKVSTDFTSGLDSAHDVAVQADGKIVAAGDADFQSIALARYGVDGLLDSAFGAGGKVTSDVVAGSESARGVALEPGGAIVVAGYASGGGGRFAIARYLGG